MHRFRRPSLYERSPLYHFLAASLIIESEGGGRETREITRRAKLRKTTNPMEINDYEFIKRYCLNKEAVIFLCEQLRQKTSLKLSSRTSLELKVLCALSFYATGSYQHTVGIAKYLGQTTVSKCVKEVTDALITPALLSDFIKFPNTRADIDIIKNKFFEKFGLPGVVGCIDGCHFNIFTPNKEIEHLFYHSEHLYSINVQMICDSECRILNVNPKYGGATHKAFIWENSLANDNMQMLHRNNEQVWLLGDSGYPLQPWLMTPILDAADESPENKYTALHKKTMVTIENTFSQLKNRWHCLCKGRSLNYAPDKYAKIIIACCVLHNLAINFNVPEPELQNTNTPENILEEDDTEDDVIRGLAIRNMLVDRINRLT